MGIISTFLTSKQLSGAGVGRPAGAGDRTGRGGGETLLLADASLLADRKESDAKITRLLSISVFGILDNSLKFRRRMSGEKSVVVFSRVL